MMHDMDTIIESALSNKRFEVYYQPIYSVKEKKFHSAEALIRLKDEKYGFISPEVFIPVAEKSGAIHKIGDFVLEQVCAFIASDEYKKLGMSYIEVNLSVVQCMQPKLANHIMEILTRYGVRPEQLNLEITESLFLDKPEELNRVLDRLQKLGFKLEVDDFGSGFSSLNLIRNISVDTIKIDKEFLDSEIASEKGKIVVNHTIGMAKDLHLQVIAEGVETKAHVDFLKNSNCDIAQGFYFAKPMPVPEFERIAF